RVREITRRNRGIAFERVVHELNEFLTGWVTYFRYAECKTHMPNAWFREQNLVSLTERYAALQQ
ncbi:MAG: group II intron reverse transcriptase/maturase, partial [Chloroflexi bacterium]|nr:group II intron reverse transcriptase/maturase [Chloroflexota bacterium]